MSNEELGMKKDLTLRRKGAKMKRFNHEPSQTNTNKRKIARTKVRDYKFVSVRDVCGKKSYSSSASLREVL
jgi:hypothetical protein